LAEKEIKEGSIVRYKGTGTAGVVKVIKTEEDGKWAFLDTTNLYYHVSTLEPLEHMPEKREIGARTLEEFEEQIELEQKKLSELKMEDESVESGG